MKRLSVILVVVLAFVSNVVMAGEVVNYTTLDTNGNITRTYTDIGNFDAVTSKVVGDIYFTQTTDGSSSLRIIGEAKYVERIKVVVVEGMLNITDNMEKRKTINNGGKELRIELSAPTLKKIVGVGVGDVKIPGRFTVKNLTIINKGVGDIDIKNLECESLTVKNSGIGDVELVGKANTADLTLSGVGDIEAYKFMVANLKVTSLGVGDVECYASKSINAESRGVGGINYKGSPKEANIISKGVGGVKRKR
jgi:hypothetical protein